MTSGPDEPTVLRELRDGVLYLTLNRPRRLNAMSDVMRWDLLAAIHQSADDPEARAIVLIGAGANFCAGGDVNDMAAGGQSSAARILRGRRIVEALTHHPKPVIAAVRGWAVGAGFSLALACDLIVATPDAKFSMVFVKRGLAPDMGASYFLARQVGLYRAKRLALTGQVLSADEAQALGLLAELWPSETFEEQLHRYAATLAAGPTLALAATRKLIGRSFETDLAGVLDLEELAQPTLAASEDHVEAIDAFKNKREPRFRGR